MIFVRIFFLQYTIQQTCNLNWIWDRGNVADRHVDIAGAIFAGKT
jgi:hypothetical protein